uniref:Uncharacterized protein n=1 Tax=Plectus sambesii TaxID=2011161 RepID=A0A914WFE3_9BILA
MKETDARLTDETQGGRERGRASTSNDSPVSRATEQTSTRLGALAETRIRERGQRRKIDGSAKRGKVGEHRNDPPASRADRPTACHSSSRRAAPLTEFLAVRPRAARPPINAYVLIGGRAPTNRRPSSTGISPFTGAAAAADATLTSSARSHRPPLSRQPPTTHRQKCRWNSAQCNIDETIS